MALLPRRHQVLNNATLTTGAANSGTLPNLDRSLNPTVVMLLDVQGPVTGGGTLTITVYGWTDSLRKGVVQTITETAVLTNPVRIPMHDFLENNIEVDWAVTGGASPSFGGVYLDLLMSSPDA